MLFNIYRERERRNFGKRHVDSECSFRKNTCSDFSVLDLGLTKDSSSSSKSSCRPVSLSSVNSASPSGGSNEVAEDGVSLKDLQDLGADAAFLETQVVEWLDNEWIPQDCHQEVAKVAAKAYVKARDEGIADLGGVLLHVGTELEDMDMGDAFVDAWMVANKVSDLLLMRMGREVCCPEPEFTDEQRVLMTEGRGEREIMASGLLGRGAPGSKATLGGGSGGSSLLKDKDVPQLLNPQAPPAFFTLDAVLRSAEQYVDEFARFDFIRKFLDGHDEAWVEANIIMAIILGYKFDEWGNTNLEDVHERFRELAFPPDFRGNEEMRAMLDAILREDEDEDKMKGLEEFLEVMVGKAYYHQSDKDDNEDFACRATLIKWIYEYDFVNDWPRLPTVQALLEVKARIDAKQEENKPPQRFLY